MCSLPPETLISLLASSCGRGALAELLRWCSGVAVPGRSPGTAACPLSCSARPALPALGSSGRREVRRGEQVQAGQPLPLPSVICSCRSVLECRGTSSLTILQYCALLHDFCISRSVLELLAGLARSAVIQGRNQKGFLSVK